MNEPKLCPYRRHATWAEPVAGKEFDYRFAPCLQDKCAMWRVKELPPLHQNAIIDGQLTATKDFEATKVGYCGLAGEIGGPVS